MTTNNTETKWTKGPWEARANRVYTTSGGEVAVATKSDPSHRHAANWTAHLIAAAPELYEALAELVSADMYMDDTNEKQDALAAARDALAKARGETA